jgi:polyphosphate kinase 2 (PPK2 family)
MKINVQDFRVQEGEKVKLEKWPTLVEPVYKSKKKYHKLLEEHVEELSSLQRLHYASSRYAVLLIFQAMDAAGKDGAIRHVMSGVNPQGCQRRRFLDRIDEPEKTGNSVLPILKRGDSGISTCRPMRPA